MKRKKYSSETGRTLVTAVVDTCINNTSVPVAKFATGGVETDCKIATGVVDTGGAP